ncbi:MAG: hypothetical protein LBB18_02120 [Puniceicoccales bacterium]|nr:hypothetical protein [Puniceicoccales bacterium]
MATHISSARQRFLALSIRQKAIFLSILCTVLLASLLSFPQLIRQLIAETVKIRNAESEQKLWFSKESKIESDIVSFTKSYNLAEHTNPRNIGAMIEKFAAESGSDYTIVRDEDGSLGQFLISRLRVIFTGITLSALVDFFNKIATMKNGVTVTETNIKAQGDGTLDVFFTVSILNTKRD